jgi:hypothetical protein
MANRRSYPFTISSQHRSNLGALLAPGHTVVATLTVQPRAQKTPEELTQLGSGLVRHQWGLGIGPDDCNKLYVMHRAHGDDFNDAQLAIQMKTNVGQTTSDQCHNHGYGPTEIHYEGSELGVLVVERTDDGLTLKVRAYDMVGATVLSSSFSTAVPSHWNGVCGISIRGDNCLADGVITV